MPPSPEPLDPPDTPVPGRGGPQEALLQPPQLELIPPDVHPRVLLDPLQHLGVHLMKEGQRVEVRVQSEVGRVVEQLGQ